jgi:hypothetical protein
MAGLGNWLTAVCAHPDRLPDAQCRALVGLALCLDWTTGKGFASITTAAKRGGCGTRTVDRAVAWARKRDLLAQTRRGRHVGRGSSSRASEWQTRVPLQPVALDGARARKTPDIGALPASQDANGNVAARQLGHRSTPDIGAPSNSYSSNSYSSTRGRERAAAAIRAVFAGLSDDETRQIAETIIREHRPSDPVAYVKALAASGDLARYMPCDTTAPGPHSEACRRGDSRDCGMGWCECRCHDTGQPPAGEVGSS